MPDGRSTKPGRRRVDHERQVTWRDYQRLRTLLWAVLALSGLFGLGWGVTTWVLFRQVQDSRVYATRALCAATDGVRAGTVDGFYTLADVAQGAGLSGPGVRDVRGIARRLQHPPAAQDCRRIVATVKHATTAPVPTVKTRRPRR